MTSDHRRTADREASADFVTDEIGILRGDVVDDLQLELGFGGGLPGSGQDFNLYGGIDSGIDPMSLQSSITWGEGSGGNDDADCNDGSPVVTEGLAWLDAFQYQGSSGSVAAASGTAGESYTEKLNSFLQQNPFDQETLQNLARLYPTMTGEVDGNAGGSGGQQDQEERYQGGLAHSEFGVGNVSPAALVAIPLPAWGAEMSESIECGGYQAFEAAIDPLQISSSSSSSSWNLPMPQTTASKEDQPSSTGLNTAAPPNPDIRGSGGGVTWSRSLPGIDGTKTPIRNSTREEKKKNHTVHQRLTLMDTPRFAAVADADTDDEPQGETFASATKAPSTPNTPLATETHPSFLSPKQTPQSKTSTASSSRATTPSAFSATSSSITTDPALIVRLCDLFFEHHYPQGFQSMIHPPSFMRDVFSQPRVILYALCAVACKYSDHPDIVAENPVPRHRGIKFYNLARGLVPQLLEERPTLELVIALGLLCVAASVQRMLYYADLALSLAVSLELNRDPDEIIERSTSPTFFPPLQDPSSSSFLDTSSLQSPTSWSWLHREQRRRVWWSIWNLHMLWCLVGREVPPFTDYSVRLPAPEILWESADPIDGELPPALNKWFEGGASPPVSPPALAPSLLAAASPSLSSSPLFAAAVAAKPHNTENRGENTGWGVDSHQDERKSEGDSDVGSRATFPTTPTTNTSGSPSTPLMPNDRQRTVAESYRPTVDTYVKFLELMHLWPAVHECSESFLDCEERSERRKDSTDEGQRSASSLVGAEEPRTEAERGREARREGTSTSPPMEDWDEKRTIARNMLLSWFEGLPPHLRNPILHENPSVHTGGVDHAIKREDDGDGGNGAAYTDSLITIGDGDLYHHPWLLVAIHVVFRAMLIAINCRKMESIVNRVVSASQEFVQHGLKKRHQQQPDFGGDGSDPLSYPFWLHDDAVSECTDSATIVSEVLQHVLRITRRAKLQNVAMPGYTGYFLFRCALVHLSVARALSAAAAAVSAAMEGDKSDDNDNNSGETDSVPTIKEEPSEKNPPRGPAKKRRRVRKRQDLEPLSLLTPVSACPTQSSSKFWESEIQNFENGPDSNLYWLRWMMSTRAVWHVQRVFPILRTLRLMSQRWLTSSGYHDSLTEMTTEALKSLGVVPEITAGAAPSPQTMTSTLSSKTGAFCARSGYGVDSGGGLELQQQEQKGIPIIKCSGSPPMPSGSFGETTTASTSTFSLSPSVRKTGKGKDHIHSDPSVNAEDLDGDRSNHESKSAFKAAPPPSSSSTSEQQTHRKSEKDTPSSPNSFAHHVNDHLATLLSKLDMSRSCQEEEYFVSKIQSLILRPE
ncbi:hypothetical protein HK102_011483 [Quaeritorhiza haematococci]|nr:hypothetical protein HK102_011483 [Quaeritorhiza haematococci]